MGAVGMVLGPFILAFFLQRHLTELNLVDPIR